ncbi:MAG: hypothetical protein JRM80_03940 [Nitrososphaerota archaeon]|nr:hypothetical protein [Nitrososphaerota archaeon]
MPSGGVGVTRRAEPFALLKSHPVVFLLLLTPGIPEYLSGSSAVSALLLNPALFVFQALANLGLYGSGALLIREAKVRWNKGWGTVLLLGGAYGILEEGVALSTLFNPNAGPVGSLGIYGHWLGVNWIWLAGIVPFHAVFSISLPIYLMGLALPETSGRSLVNGKRVAITSAVLAVDVLLLMAVVNHTTGYWMGSTILVGSLASIAVLVWAACRVPADLLTLGAGNKAVSNRALAAIGLSFFPAILLSEGLPQGAGVPPSVDFALVLLVQALYPVYLTRRSWPQRGTISLALGLIIPIAVFGLISQLGLPLVLLADAAIFLLFKRLWRQTFCPC